MSHGLLVKPRAEEDLAEAYAWLEEQRLGLGEELLLCVEAAIELACREPEYFPAVHREVRRAQTRRFPYGIFYLVEPKRIVVLAIHHSSRDPEGWHDRLQPGEEHGEPE